MQEGKLEASDRLLKKTFALGIASWKKLATFAARFSRELSKKTLVTGADRKRKKSFGRCLEIEKVFLPLQPAPKRRFLSRKRKSADRLNGPKREKKRLIDCLRIRNYFRPLHTENEQRSDGKRKQAPAFRWKALT
ncbi:hypothetical protein [Pontibacter virosus]|uniref:hypothetical protein n=1 Tax=Pontibacter virosus TaxID=1765052 RepID=UPI00105783C3|nr:hypothetical protein [Pontibacter virosus]